MSSTASSTRHYIFDYFGPNIRLFWPKYSTEFDSVELLIALPNVTKGMLLPNPLDSFIY